MYSRKACVWRKTHFTRNSWKGGSCKSLRLASHDPFSREQFFQNDERKMTPSLRASPTKPPDSGKEEMEPSFFYPPVTAACPRYGSFFKENETAVEKVMCRGQGSFHINAEKERKRRKRYNIAICLLSSNNLSVIFGRPSKL